MNPFFQAFASSSKSMDFDNANVNYEKGRLTARYLALYQQLELAEGNMSNIVFDTPPEMASQRLAKFLTSIGQGIAQSLQQLAEVKMLPQLQNSEKRLHTLAKKIEEEHRSFQNSQDNEYQEVKGEAWETFEDIFKHLHHECDLSLPYVPEEIPLDWRAHSSPLQQQAILQDPAQVAELNAVLTKIKHLRDQKGRSVDCFISYAWPNPQRTDEVWVQPFLKIFTQHLQTAGIRTYLDINDSRYGFNSYEHMQRIESCDVVLLMGTPSLVDKFKAGVSSVCHELSLIQCKREMDRQKLHHGVIGILLNGSLRDSFPAYLERFTVTESFKVSADPSILDVGYAGRLRELIATIFSWQQEAEYQKIWQELETLHPEWLKPLTEAEVKALLQPTLATTYQASRHQALPPTPYYGLPLPNGNFTGREEALTQLVKNFQSSQLNVITQAASGLGGVGKSQLANYYANLAKDHKPCPLDQKPLHYDYIVWLNGKTLEESFIDLAEALKVSTEAYKGNRVGLVKHIYKVISNRYSHILLVFDDAQNHEAIRDYLPLQHPQSRFHVLITTRSDHWLGIPKISLEGFSEEEAVSYILKLLPAESKENAQALAKLLHYFPLALSQAVAYIGRSRRGIAAYIRLYHANQHKLLASKPLQQDDYTHTVYTTWYLSIEAFRKEVPQAEALLDVGAFLAPKAIPLKLMQESLALEEIDLEEALITLCDYSLISNVSAQSFDMHQLLQEVIRLHLKAVKYQAIQPSPSCSLLSTVQVATNLQGISEASEHHVWLLTVFDYLSTHFDYDKRNPQSWQEAKVLFSHSEHTAQLVYREKLKLPQLAALYEKLGCFQTNIFSDGHQALPCFQAALAICKQYFGENSVEVARVLGNMGNAYSVLGKIDQEQALMEQSFMILESHYGAGEHIEMAIALNNLANVMGARGNHEQKKVLLERALKIQEAYYGPEHVEVASTLNNLANAVGALGNTRQKKKLLERALKIFEMYYGLEHIEVACTLNNLANAEGDLGNTKQKKMHLERALKIQEAHYGSEHIEVASTLANLANAVGALGDRKQQRELFERVLKIEEAHYEPEHVEVATTLGNLAIAIGSLGDMKQAKALLERALKIQQTHYGPAHIELTGTLNNLAAVMGALGNREQAKTILEEALKIKEAHYGLEHIEITKTLNNLANAVGEIGDIKRKKALLERALKIEELHYGPEHPEVAFTLKNLARAFLSEGQPSQALSLLERAYGNFIKTPGYGVSHPEAASIKDCIQKLRQRLAEASTSKASKSNSAVAEASHIQQNPMQQYNHRGIEHFKAKRYSEAITIFQAAVSQALLSHPDPEGEAILASIYNNLAAAYRETRQYDKAIEHFGQYMVYHEKVSGNRSEAYQKASQKKAACEAKLQSLALNKEGVAHFKAGRFDEALGCFKRVLRTNREFYREAHEDTATAAFNVGSCYWRLEYFEEAIPYLQQAFNMRQQLLGESHADTQKAKQRLKDCQLKVSENYKTTIRL